MASSQVKKQSSAELGRQRWFGRLWATDERDHKFMLRPSRSEAAQVVRRTWRVPRALDQGPHPHCVGYAGVGFLLAAPVRNKKIDPVGVYHECQKHDEWPGEDYDGTSVRALFKVLKRDGYVTSYQWAFDAEVVVDHLLTVGPVVLGTAWHRRMDRPDEHGFLNVDGDVVGGHAYLAHGVDRRKLNPRTGERGAVKLLNSWGTDWGLRGHAYISLSDLGRLIINHGEACTSLEVVRGGVS